MSSSFRGSSSRTKKNSEEDETLNVLDRYEKSHHLKVHKDGEIKYTESPSKNSVTQQSQIDPVFYQQLLHKNTLEEVALTESKLQQFNHLVSLSQGDIQQVKKNAKNSKSIKVFDHIVE